jgi:tetratricopeptide (TPR) repeat protein
VAALFGLHPLRVESVAWVSERKDVLCGLFWSLSLLAYGWYARRPGLGRYLLVVLGCVLSLLAKPMAVTLPCVLLLLDWWPLARGRALRSWRPLLLEKLPLFALSAASCVVTYLVQRGAMDTLHFVPLGDRLANALLSYLTYVYQTLWPSDLAVLYPYPVDGVPVWQWLGAAALLVGITVVVLRLARRCPYLAVGWLWYLGTLVPVIGIVQVGLQAHADRYTYIPSIGLFLAAVWGVADLAARADREQLAALAGGGVLAAALALSWIQVGYWSSDEELWRHTLQVTGPDNPFAHFALGETYVRNGDTLLGIEHYLEAIRMGLNYAQMHNTIGLQQLERCDREQAVRHLELAHQLDPARTSYRNNLAAALLAAGRVDDAISHLRAILRDRPDYHMGWLNLGVALEKKGSSPDEALAAIRRAVALAPRKFEPHVILGAALKRRGDAAGARFEYEQAFQLQPRWPEGYNRRAWELAANPNERRRDGSEAVRLAEIICDATTERVPEFLQTRAAAYAEAGRFDAAVASAQAALERARASSSDPRLVPRLEEQLRLYQARKPFRDPALEEDRQAAPAHGRSAVVRGSSR